jgi:hypothetical protein
VTAGHINEAAILGAETLPEEIKAKATVTLGEENGDAIAVVAWPDPTFHERYVVILLDAGKWLTIARGWKGQFVRPAPFWLPEPKPAPDWIIKKIEEHRARAS